MVRSRGKSPFFNIHSITVEASSVAASSVARSRYRVEYYGPLSVILQIVVPGIALYRVEGRSQSNY